MFTTVPINDATAHPLKMINDWERMIGFAVNGSKPARPLEQNNFGSCKDTENGWLNI